MRLDGFGGKGGPHHYPSTQGNSRSGDRGFRNDRSSVWDIEHLPTSGQSHFHHRTPPCCRCITLGPQGSRSMDVLSPYHLSPFTGSGKGREDGAVPGWTTSWRHRPGVVSVRR